MPDRFAWCFDHGQMHHFAADETPWCGAAWVWLAGATEAEAMDDRASRFGEARFFDQIPHEQQYAIVTGRVPGYRMEDDDA